MHDIIKFSNNLYLKGYEKESLAALEIKEAMDNGDISLAKDITIKLADSLDEQDLVKEANFLDKILSNISVENVFDYVTQIPGIEQIVGNYVKELKAKVVKEIQSKLGIDKDGYLAILTQELFANLTVQELIVLFKEPSCELITSELVEAMQSAALKYKFSNKIEQKAEEYIAELLGLKEGTKVKEYISDMAVETTHRGILNYLTQDTTFSNYASQLACDIVMPILEGFSFVNYIEGKDSKTLIEDAAGY